MEARKTFLHLQESKTQFSKYALLEHAESKENYCVLDILNTNEFIAVGIRESAFDEKTYKRLSRSRFIRDWDTLEPYVVEFRRTRGISTLFTEFQWLAERWKKK